jgi:hypothetical protein
MKKIIVLTMLMLSFAASAFAAGVAVATNSLIGDATAGTGGLAVYGGVDDAAAALADANPLVRLSTGVQAVVNFTAATHLSYAIITKHVSGSKYFGTANDSTNVYWKQSTKGNLVPATAGTAVDNSNFTVAGSWTAY